MKEDTRKRLAKLILEELSDKIKGHESLGRKLEAFTDLPVEKVADAILKQFEYLLSSDLRDLIIHLIEQEIASEEYERKKDAVPNSAEENGTSDTLSERAHSENVLMNDPEDEEASNETADEPVPSQSIMEHFGVKEHFPTQPMDIDLAAFDWLYILGFGYAPDSAGKGIPSVKLDLKGIDNGNNIFLLDYGDVRLYLHKLNSDDFTKNKTGEPALTSKASAPYKFAHERILNILRTSEILVPMPFWTVMQGTENVIRLVENRYVEFLRVLIDVHDASEWDVDVSVYDEHIAELPEINTLVKGRTQQREMKHPAGKKIDVKIMEKVILLEKNIAQQIHSQLLLKAAKAKIDFIIRLDSAFLDDRKSIFTARYSIGKEKRKTFWQTISRLQDDFKEYELMFHISSPQVKFLL